MKETPSFQGGQRIDPKLWDGGSVYTVVSARGPTWVGGSPSSPTPPPLPRRIGKAGATPGETPWGAVWFLLSIISSILILARSKRFVPVAL